MLAASVEGRDLFRDEGGEEPLGAASELAPDTRRRVGVRGTASLRDRVIRGGIDTLDTLEEVTLDGRRVPIPPLRVRLAVISVSRCSASKDKTASVTARNGATFSLLLSSRWGRTSIVELQPPSRPVKVRSGSSSEESDPADEDAVARRLRPLDEEKDVARDVTG